MNLLSTFAGSMMEGFLPAGWDLSRIDDCCALEPAVIGERQGWWHPDFELIPCASGSDFDVMMGHEIATTIRRTREHVDEAPALTDTENGVQRRVTRADMGIGVDEQRLYLPFR